MEEDEGVVVRLELVSFGWGFGPGRREGGHSKRELGKPGGAWAAALNLRRFANPPASMRRRGLTGLDRELQAAVWAAPKAEAFYEKVRADVVALLTNRVRSLLSPATTQQPASDGQGKSEGEDEDSDQSSGGEEPKSEDEESDDEGEEESDDEGEGAEDDEDGHASKVVTITIGLGCEKGKHRSVAVVERLLREECLRSVTITGRPQPVAVEVTARHRDINKTGKEAQRGFKGRQHAEARNRKRGGGAYDLED